MTKVKLCGLKRFVDIRTANLLKPEFIGFVFAAKSKRYITPETAEQLKSNLNPGITAVGVFVNEDPITVADLLKREIIDFAQLHGTEDEDYILRLRTLTDKPLIRALRIKDKNDLEQAEICSADYILLDAGAGDGLTFDWDLLAGFRRPYFLAGGLGPANVQTAIQKLHPYAVDVSSGIETDGLKDAEKMTAFVKAARE